MGSNDDNFGVVNLIGNLPRIPDSRWLLSRCTATMACWADSIRYHWLLLLHPSLTPYHGIRIGSCGEGTADCPAE